MSHTVTPHCPVPLHTHRAPLDHQRHDLKQRVRSRHSRMLSIGIVGGSDLYNIGSDEIDTLEAADDSAKLAGRPAACFGGACCGRDCDGFC